MADLLPSSATPQERAIASLDDRLDNLPVPFRDFWDPYQCPLPLLPYLALHYSVDQWNDHWPEHIKRQTIEDALYQHRIKGSRLAVENAIASFGTTANILEWWEKSPKGNPHTFSVTISAQDNERQLPVYELSEDKSIHTSEAIPVNTSRVYRIRFKVRALSATSENNEVVAGVACLNSNFGSALHRQAAINGGAEGRPKPENGWLVFEGEITGYGSTSDTFTETTQYIRPYFRVNRTGGNNKIQVAELECWDLFENRQLIENPHFEQGLKGWSTSLVGEDISDNAPGTITTAAFRPDADLQTDIIKAIEQAKPLRSHFDFTVGTIHPGTLHLRSDMHQVIMSRETWE
ncbi:MAG: phage tail protein I [Endozoicomonas sp.]|uniref:phage tail protein I n=1 Tax=Endozoicomonas sp. TaxID=1892382 RepID=UPI003D9B8031